MNGLCESEATWSCVSHRFVPAINQYISGRKEHKISINLTQANIDSKTSFFKKLLQEEK